MCWLWDWSASIHCDTLPWWLRWPHFGLGWGRTFNDDNDAWQTLMTRWALSSVSRDAMLGQIWMDTPSLRPLARTSDVPVPKCLFPTQCRHDTRPGGYRRSKHLRQSVITRQWMSINTLLVKNPVSWFTHIQISMSWFLKLLWVDMTMTRSMSGHSKVVVYCTVYSGSSCILSVQNSSPEKPIELSDIGAS